jgi:DNA invertase Pin-like site-specific DNA recombinase
MVAAFAEFERSILIERCKAGQDAARRRGAKIGRPRVRVDLLRALAMRREGKSLRVISARLGIGAATLQRALASAVVEDDDPEVPVQTAPESPEITVAA